MKIMNHMSRAVKGQLSFDMGFALIFVMIVIGMTIAYYNNTEATMTVMHGRHLMAYGTVADAAAAELQSFYASIMQLPAGDNATLSLHFSDAFYADAGGRGNKYSLAYNVTDFRTGTLTVVDFVNATLYATRGIGFGISCNTGGWTVIFPGQSLTLTDCHIDSGDLKCGSCSVT